MIDENEEGCQLFMLMEELFEDVDATVNSNEDLQIGMNAIELLIRGGYFFEAKKPAEILHSVNRFLTVPLNPLYIELAIMRYCEEEDEKEGLLKKCESLINGFQYEES